MKQYTEEQIEHIFDLLDEIEVMLTMPKEAPDEEDSESSNKSIDLSRYDDIFPF